MPRTQIKPNTKTTALINIHRLMARKKKILVVYVHVCVLALLCHEYHCLNDVVILICVDTLYNLVINYTVCIDTQSIDGITDDIKVYLCMCNGLYDAIVFRP